jgi:hypothetical protein
MKKLFAAVLAALTLCACGTAAEPAANTAPNTDETLGEFHTITAQPSETAPQTTATEAAPPETDILTEAIITEIIEEPPAPPAIVLIDDSMPLPFGENPSDGDAYDGFYMPGKAKFNGVPTALIKLTDGEKVTAWFESFEVTKNPPDSLLGYPNIYSFIKEFGLTDEQVLEAMPGSDNPQLLSKDEIEMLIGGDLNLVTETFASDYAIVINENIYCPSWIYTHTTDAYAAAGITPEMLSGKMGVYKDLSLTDEARAAFNAKIEGYTE